MNKIKKYAKDIEEELESAKCYMEKALEWKAAGNSTRYARYKEMSAQELSHAMTLHEYAVQDIEQLEKRFEQISSLVGKVAVLEGNDKLMDEKLKVCNHRLEDLEAKVMK